MAVSNGFDLAFRIASTVVLARLLMPAHFGLLGMVTAITSVAEQFSSLGLSTATVQAKGITHRQCSNLFWINAGAGIVMATAIFLSAPLVAAFYADSRLTPITIAISINFVWGGLAVQHEALLSRQMRQPASAVNRLVASVGSTLVAVVLALLGFEYWALVWREVVRSAMITVGVYILCPWIPGLPGPGAGTGNLLRFGRDLTFAQVLIAAVMRLDNLLIGKVGGAVPLGFYRQAQNLLAPLEYVNNPIQSVAQPGLSVLHTDPEKYRRYYQRIVFVVALVTMPTSIFCALYSEEIVQILLGEKWLGASIFLAIVSLAAAIRPVIGTSGLVLITRGRHKRLLLLAILHSVVLALFMLIGVRWQALGVAVAHIATTCVLMLPKLYYSFLESPVTIMNFLCALYQPFVATIIMAAAIVIFQRTIPFERALLSVGFGGSLAVSTFLGSLLLMPGGHDKMSVLAADIAKALRARSARPQAASLHSGAI